MSVFPMALVVLLAQTIAAQQSQTAPAAAGISAERLARMDALGDSSGVVRKAVAALRMKQ